MALFKNVHGTEDFTYSLIMSVLSYSTRTLGFPFVTQKFNSQNTKENGRFVGTKQKTCKISVSKHFQIQIRSGNFVTNHYEKKVNEICFDKTENR